MSRSHSRKGKGETDFAVRRLAPVPSPVERSASGVSGRATAGVTRMPAAGVCRPEAAGRCGARRNIMGLQAATRGAWTPMRRDVSVATATRRHTSAAVATDGPAREMGRPCTPWRWNRLRHARPWREQDGHSTQRSLALQRAQPRLHCRDHVDSADAARGAGRGVRRCEGAGCPRQER